MPRRAPRVQGDSNGIADKEEGFDVSKCVKDAIPCWYRHQGTAKPCTGLGHFGRHHALCYTEKGAKEAEEFLKKKAEKGGGKGRVGKGGPKGGRGDGQARMLNFDGSHATDQQERTDRAAKLLASRMVIDADGETLGEAKPGGSRINLDECHEFDSDLWKPPPARGWLVRTASQVRHYLFKFIMILMGFLALMAVVGHCRLRG